MANQTILNIAEEDIAKAACPIINQCEKLGLKAADLTPATDLASLLSQIEAAKLRPTVHLADRQYFEMLKNYCVWLAGKDMLTDPVINALATVSGIAAATDLRFLFSDLVKSAPFDPSAKSYYTDMNVRLP